MAKKTEQLEGYCYDTYKPVTRTRDDWSTMIESAKATGGRKVRLEDGDLLIIERRLGTCVIIAEVYGY